MSDFGIYSRYRFLVSCIKSEAKGSKVMRQTGCRLFGIYSGKKE